MIHVIIFLIAGTLLPHSSAHAIFEYDRAIRQSQKNNWSGSLQHLKAALTHDPERPDILYDAGISSYKNGEFDKALTYFNNAADSKKAPQLLQEQAHFNAGNTLVQLKQLQQAIDSYDAVLRLNPAHEKARHNKEMVKKMLEQEKQNQKDKENQDQEQKQENQNNTNNNDHQNDQNQNDPKSDDQKNQPRNDNNANQQEDPHKQNRNPSKKPGNKNQEQSQKEHEQNEKKQQEQQKQQNAGNSESDTKKDEPSSAKTKPSCSSQDTQKRQQLSGALEYVLNEHEKKDAQLNKKMIKEMAHAQAGDSHVTRAW